MAVKTNNKEKRAKQNIRTKQNRKRKYQKLIDTKPNDKQVSIWKKKLESS